MGKTVRELVELLGTDELVTWMAYIELNPPHLRDDIRAGKLAYYAAHSFKRSATAEKILADFAPNLPKRVSTPDQMIAAFGPDVPAEIVARKWKAK